MNSIRLRALLGAVVTAWGIFAVLAVVDYRAIRDLLVYHFDDELRTHAGALASLVHLAGDRLVLQFEEQVLPFYRSSPKAEYFQVWDGSGKVMRRSESLGEHDLPAEWGTPEAPRIVDMVLPDGRPGRAIGVGYVRGAHAVGIAVAEPRQLLDAALSALVVSSAWTAVSLGIALAVLLWLVLKKGLRPLEELSAKVARLDVRQLPERVGMGAVPVEIAPVVARLDELLGRVRAAMARERRVTSNIAHELMTPLAELRALSDVAIRLPEDTDYQRRAALATNETTIRMQAVAEKVMELATAESHAAALVRVPTDLAALLRDVVGLARVRADQRSVTLQLHAPSELMVESDSVAVRVVLDNLVQNAAEHAPAGSSVRVELVATDGIVVSVRNDAPELTPEDLPQLTEPYWRKDAARTTGTTHAGIGLALAKELAERLGGDLSLDLHRSVLSVSLRLTQHPGKPLRLGEATPVSVSVDSPVEPTSETRNCPSGPLVVPAVVPARALALSVVIPTFNERENISVLVRQLTERLDPVLGTNYELIVVDDDSPDRTWEVATELAALYPRLRVVRRVGERGLSTAVVRGWQSARGTVLGVIDADLQHPPEVAVSLWNAVHHGADMAVGSRHVEEGGVSDWSVFRRALSRGAQLIGLIVLPGVVGRINDPMSGYFMVRREAIAGVELSPLGYKILIEVLGRGDVHSIREVGYVFRERHEGKSKVGWRLYVEYLRHLVRLRVTNMHVRRFLRFAVVGTTGVIVDMAVLYLLSDPHTLGLGLTRSKVVAAELAIVNNFLWNDSWTFREFVGSQRGLASKFHRFVKFNVVCGLGLLINVGLLNLMFNLLQMNRYVANVIAIGLVTMWNYWINVKLRWRSTDARGMP